MDYDSFQRADTTEVEGFQDWKHPTVPPSQKQGRQSKQIFDSQLLQIKSKTSEGW